MTFCYRLNEANVTDESGALHAVYGADATDASGNILESVTDIFFHRQSAEDFIALCNALQLHPRHLRDAAENALVAQYSL